MEFKNRKFRFFDNVWSLKFEDRFMTGEDIGSSDKESIVYGYTDYTTNTIVIALRNKDNRPYTKESVEQTVRHELVHIILSSGQYHHSNSDEPLVEWIARGVGELLKRNILV